MNPLEEAMNSNSLLDSILTRTKDEPQYMKSKIVFRAILTVTVYPNGKIATHVSRPLEASNKIEPKQKKKGQKQESKIREDEVY